MKVYIGTYGARKDGQTLDPIECADDAGEWLESTLKGAINSANTAAWAQGQLRIMADMLDDRAMDHFADEARRIANGLTQRNPSALRGGSESHDSGNDRS